MMAFILTLDDALFLFSSPSMDESATKEELRPVKKQLVGCFFQVRILFPL